MKTFVTLAAAATLTLLLAACREEPDEAPPVGTAAGAMVTMTSALPTPSAGAGAFADAGVDPAIRHADFRLAMLDARERLQAARQACAAGNSVCHERALSDYDLATAAAAREFAIDAAEVVDLQRPPAPDPGSAPLVQLGGSRG